MDASGLEGKDSKMTKAKFLAFAGSARKESFNKKLITAVAARAEALGAQVTVIDLADYAMPLYDGDLEQDQGLPENAAALRQLLDEHDGLLIATPEYNAFFPPLLKNTLDWISRPADGKNGLEYFKAKPVALFAASPGRLGGIRALNQLRTQMSELGSIVPSSGVAVAQAHEAFDDDGNIVNDGTAKMVDQTISSAMALIS